MLGRPASRWSGHVLACSPAGRIFRRIPVCCHSVALVAFAVFCRPPSWFASIAFTAYDSENPALPFARHKITFLHWERASGFGYPPIASLPVRPKDGRPAWACVLSALLASWRESLDALPPLRMEQNSCLVRLRQCLPEPACMPPVFIALSSPLLSIWCIRGTGFFPIKRHRKA